MLPVRVLNPAGDAGALGGRVREVCEEYYLRGVWTDKPNLSDEVRSERERECAELRERHYTQAPRDNAGSFTAHHWIHTWVPGMYVPGAAPKSNVGETFRSAVPLGQGMRVLSDAEVRALMADAGVHLPAFGERSSPPPVVGSYDAVERLMSARGLWTPAQRRRVGAGGLRASAARAAAYLRVGPGAPS